MLKRITIKHCNTQTLNVCNKIKPVQKATYYASYGVEPILMLALTASIPVGIILGAKILKIGSDKQDQNSKVDTKEKFDYVATKSKEQKFNTRKPRITFGPVRVGIRPKTAQEQLWKSSKIDQNKVNDIKKLNDLVMAINQDPDKYDITLNGHFFYE
jgi:hypothetical protein